MSEQVCINKAKRSNNQNYYDNYSFSLKTERWSIKIGKSNNAGARNADSGWFVKHTYK